MVRTFHPRPCSAFLLALSLSRFRSNLADQYATFERGLDFNGQLTFECWCQKHPCTKITWRRPGKQMSGFPGSSLAWSLYRYPSPNSNRRTLHSGRVPALRFPRMAALTEADDAPGARGTFIHFWWPQLAGLLDACAMCASQRELKAPAAATVPSQFRGEACDPQSGLSRWREQVEVVSLADTAPDVLAPTTLAAVRKSLPRAGVESRARWTPREREARHYRPGVAPLACFPQLSSYRETSEADTARDWRVDGCASERDQRPAQETPIRSKPVGPLRVSAERTNTLCASQTVAAPPFQAYAKDSCCPQESMGVSLPIDLASPAPGYPCPSLRSHPMQWYMAGRLNSSVRA